ncbi:hypothetical protein PBY51_001142 [Eleginops maclovinus]|uniref:Uncharacterized protein n=1 Tax=Eleginops maclovinus TaxID=56733 RepID=A0AAN7XH14_ELEMC|nr:hypothetical protein PBY51_001142 [Eleginops maclovinus]
MSPQLLGEVYVTDEDPLKEEAICKSVMAEDRRQSIRQSDGNLFTFLSLGDSALAPLQFTCTALPYAAASQAMGPELHSGWLAARAQPLIGYKA